MKQFLLITLACCFLFTGCSNHSTNPNKQDDLNKDVDKTIEDETIIDQDSTSETSLSSNEQTQGEESIEEFDMDKEKGTIGNPYKGWDESFQITCQIPKYGKQTEITVEFSSMELTIETYGARISGNVRLINGPTTAPIHLTDYIYIGYFCKNGLSGDSPVYDADIEDSLGFTFTENNKDSGCICSDVSNEDLIQKPQVACISYYDGSKNNKIFFARYEDGEPHGIR